MSESVERTIIILTIVCVMKKTMIFAFCVLLLRSNVFDFVHISFLYLKDILHKKSALED